MKWYRIKVQFDARSPTMVCFFKEIFEECRHSDIAQWFMFKYPKAFWIDIKEVAE